MPRTPKPPGTTTASTPASARWAPCRVSQASEATQRMSTRALPAKPPWRMASETDR